MDRWGVIALHFPSIHPQNRNREGEREAMERGENKGGAAASSTVEENERSSSMRMVETALRLVAVALCVAALFVMLRNSQTTDFGSVSYAHLTAFRYLVHANGICAGYSLLSAIVAFAPRPSTMSRACTFFLLDQVLTYIVLAAGAASTEVLYLAYKGDTSIAWGEACESFARFCHRATTSVVVTFAGVACYAALSLVSSYRLFSKFDAPSMGSQT